MTPERAAEVLSRRREHGLAGMSGGTHAACSCDLRWVPIAEFNAHLRNDGADDALASILALTAPLSATIDDDEDLAWIAGATWGMAEAHTLALRGLGIEAEQ